MLTHVECRQKLTSSHGRSRESSSISIPRVSSRNVSCSASPALSPAYPLIKVLDASVECVILIAVWGRLGGCLGRHGN